MASSSCWRRVPGDQIHLFFYKTGSWRVLRESIKTHAEGKAYVNNIYLWVAGTRPQGSPSRRSEPPYLAKGASQRNCKNCKVDISTRQGRSGDAGVKPLLLHYIIKTYNVKLRCHADSIIVSSYGRNQSVTRRSPPLRWERTKAPQKWTPAYICKGGL